MHTSRVRLGPLEHRPGGGRDRGRRRRRRDLALLAAVLGTLALGGALFHGAAGRLVAATGNHDAGTDSKTPSASPISGPSPASPRRVAPSLVFSHRWADQHPPAKLSLNAQSGFLVDLDARAVLWSRDPVGRRAPASLTKMLTAMVAVDHAALDQQLTVPDEATKVEPDSMGLTRGEILSVRELLYGLLLDSGNDAAETLGRAVMPRDRFLEAMNEKARMFGLVDSHFSNPSGLDDSGGLYSTAGDLALVAAHMLQDYPQLVEIVGTKQKTIPGTSTHKQFEPINWNKMLWQYPGAYGLKTGFTDDAGGCVVVAATRNGRHLIAVVLHSATFFTDAGRVLDYGFSIHPG